MEQLFFELIQVALGYRKLLSATPSAEEWKGIFSLARMQTLVGVCFYGTQKIKGQGQAANMPESLQMQWLAMASQIQRQNEMLNQRCAELSRRLTESGFACCLLKGQAFAELYGTSASTTLHAKESKNHCSTIEKPEKVLAGMRQSGDIDMWIKAEPENVIAWARRTGKLKSFDYHHADVRIFPDVEVELHYRPSISRNLVRNTRLQRWLKAYGWTHTVYHDSLACYVPDKTFNTVLCLNHIFCHLFFEGVGLRQLMDLYFILKSEGYDKEEKEDITQLLKRFHLLRFAAAVMWVEREVFGLQEQYMLCEPDENSGRYFLQEIMRSGNFGHHDVRLKGARAGNRLRLMWRWMKHSMRLFCYYPEDVLWTPFGIVWISMWRRKQVFGVLFAPSPSRS